jgi:hypothetical protein
MTFPTHVTDWRLSAKGNFWRRLNGKALVVGRNKATGQYWAMADGRFADESFELLTQAQRAAERL